MNTALSIPEEMIAGYIANSKKDNMAVSRIHSLVADALLKNAVKDFYEYKDTEGKVASSMKGLVIQINSKIKSKFGGSRKPSEYSQNEHDALTAIRLTLDMKIRTGVEKGKTRREIKDACYEAIDSIYDAMLSDW